MANGQSRGSSSVHFQHADGNDIGQFEDARKQVIVWPQEYKSGNLEYPCSAAQ
jgi:hypothetical protein